MVLLLCEATGGSSTMSEGHDTFLLRGRRRHGRIHVAGTASMPLEPMHHDLSKPSPHVEAAQTHISSQALISSSRHMSAIGGRGCTAVGLQPFEPNFFPYRVSAWKKQSIPIILHKSKMRSRDNELRARDMIWHCWSNHV